MSQIQEGRDAKKKKKKEASVGLDDIKEKEVEENVKDSSPREGGWSEVGILGFLKKFIGSKCTHY